MHAGDSADRGAGGREVLGGHHRQAAVPGAETRTQGWLQHCRHRVPGGQEGEGRARARAKTPAAVGQSFPMDTFCVPLPSMQVAGEELQELQCLHESTYRLAQRFCEHGDLASRHILMQHGPLPEKEEDIQVMP